MMKLRKFWLQRRSYSHKDDYGTIPSCFRICRGFGFPSEIAHITRFAGVFLIKLAEKGAQVGQKCSSRSFLSMVPALQWIEFTASWKNSPKFSPDGDSKISSDICSPCLSDSHNLFFLTCDQVNSNIVKLSVSIEWICLSIPCSSCSKHIREYKVRTSKFPATAKFSTGTWSVKRNVGYWVPLWSDKFAVSMHIFWNNFRWGRSAPKLLRNVFIRLMSTALHFGLAMVVASSITANAGEWRRCRLIRMLVVCNFRHAIFLSWHWELLLRFLTHLFVTLPSFIIRVFLAAWRDSQSVWVTVLRIPSTPVAACSFTPLSSLPTRPCFAYHLNLCFSLCICLFSCPSDVEASTTAYDVYTTHTIKHSPYEEQTWLEVARKIFDMEINSTVLNFRK